MLEVVVFHIRREVGEGEANCEVGTIRYFRLIVENKVFYNEYKLALILPTKVGDKVARLETWEKVQR